MGYIRLHPKDAEAYELDEQINFNLSELGRKQRRRFEAQAKRPLKWLLDQLSGVPELDDEGNVIPVPLLDDETDEPVIDESTGEPKMTEKLHIPDEALDMFVYLILLGHGVRVPWEDFELREVGLRVRFVDDDEAVESGKGEDPPAGSESSPTT